MADVPTVRKWMDDPPEAFLHSDPMSGAINFLSKSEFSAMPVVNDAGSLVGLLTERTPFAPSPAGPTTASRAGRLLITCQSSKCCSLLRWTC